MAGNVRNIPGFMPNTSPEREQIKNYRCWNCINNGNWFGCGGRIWTNDLRVMSPTSYQLLYPASSCYIVFDLTIFIPVLRLPQIKKAGAGDRGRTGTIGKDRRILSPVRLPIPPLRQKNGSKGGARTHSLSVNSRVLHHWATLEQRLSLLTTLIIIHEHWCYVNTNYKNFF